MPHNMIILHFRLPYFHDSNSAIFFYIALSTLILHRRRLNTFFLLKENHRNKKYNISGYFEDTTINI